MFKERVVVVTDSTSDLDPSWAKEQGIDAVVPLGVAFGSNAFLDKVDINSKEFFEQLSTSKNFPTTSAPSVGLFKKIYEEAMEKRRTKNIYSIHLPPPPMSATIDNAERALFELREERPRLQFEVANSGQVSLGLGIAALRAAEAADRKKKLPEIKEEVYQLLDRLYTFGALATLKYARKGGRLGLVKYLAGSFLRYSPIIQVYKGEIKSIANIRTRQRAIKTLTNQLRKSVNENGLFEEMAIIHGNAADDAQMVNEELKGCTKRDLGIFEMGPVLGAHAGPGTVGVSVLFPPR